MATQLPLPFLYDYSGGMLNTPDTPETLNFTKNKLPVIDTSNPQVMHAGFNFGNFGNNQATNDQLRGYGNYYDGAQEYNPDWNPNNPNYGKSFAGVGRFDPNNLNRLPSNLTQDLGAATYTGPQAPQNPIFDPAQGNIPYAPDERTGIVQTLKGFATPAMAFMKKMGGVTPEKKAAYDAIMGSRDDQGWGTYKGNKYNIQDNKVYSEVNPFGKNLYSGFGSKSLEEMDEKTLSKAMARLAAGKAISSRLRNILSKRGMLTPTGTDRVGGDLTPTTFDPSQGGTTTGGASTYSGPPTTDFNVAQFARSGGQRASTPGGFTNPGAGSYGPWKAEGGRVGYQDGELVEDEYMAEATPGGMMEENIEEVQGEPTREQLEAIALEIFRLPLEQLNEQQLEVVYQAAMEQEPSEEEVQFAAQEGPGQGIASLV